MLVERSEKCRRAMGEFIAHFIVIWLSWKFRCC